MFQTLKLDYEVKGHHYFRSTYIKDLYGHMVELTSILVDEKEFYGQSK